MSSDVVYPHVNVSDSELYKLFVAPHKNSRIIRARINEELYLLVKELCKRKGISINMLVKLLLISAVKGEMNIDVQIKRINVKTSNVDIKLKQVDENRRKVEEAKAERIIVKAQSLINKFYDDLDKMKKDVYYMDRYSTTSKRILMWKRQAEDLLLEIEKLLDKTATPEVQDRLIEYHKALLNVVKTKI